MKPLPTQQELQENFYYDPDKGQLFRRLKTTGELKPVSLQKMGKDKRPCAVKYKTQRWNLPRLIWRYMTGEDPGELQVDHINRDYTDNTWRNLRLVTDYQNTQNRDHFGIRKHKSGKWEARITVMGDRLQLGLYECPLMAGISYMNVRSVVHPFYTAL